MTDESANHIGTLNERSLHAALKDYLFQPGDEQEVKLEGYFIDIVRGEELIEIQTRSFFPLKRKLQKLVKNHVVHLYHPIAARKWIVRVDKEDNFLTRRKSPRKGNVFDIFDELLSLRNVVLHPNLWLHLLLIEVEEVWRDDGKGSWRKKYWSISDRRLVGVNDEIILHDEEDFLGLLPESLPEPFTNADLMEHAKCTKRLAGKATYALKEMGLIEKVGTKNRYHLFEKLSDP
ncbi:MAG: hypothetical protein V2J07_01815 [Anaerolineae bacterium]|jgi:hypothetical protein|nr:hypothetical protein [Anaerolineae bacterium]